ncbi:hypothetical protein SD71_10600 [Cohnella kolymensis]|uniref:Uncharacterized protein n=1 Tax=Cohnella kolymensis TaxID=1590652 RepID=A0ABR5A492_9BACL|nr:hypothetical protein [Cohnella kolymensis]KIL35839.1 hypothetical protein SD71_10600 [Cohnella kolymensis]
MSAYQLLKQFQDEVESMTGLRPDISVSFHSRRNGLSQEDSAILRNAMVEDSFNQLSPSDMPLEDEKTHWTAFLAQDNERDICFCVHGPHVAKEDAQCGA